MRMCMCMEISLLIAFLSLWMSMQSIRSHSLIPKTDLENEKERRRKSFLLMVLDHLAMKFRRNGILLCLMKEILNNTKIVPHYIK